jgi:hypothetical protein
MNIELHIDRLILEGIDLEFADRGLLETAVTAELTRLLQANGLRGGAGNGRSLASLTANPISLPENQSANNVGQEIGRAVYSTVAGGQHK